mmetsp:Transcript_39328/g.44919  ORF Transcript_39328/g.44919 Transcript_39328/m.44919 type:complete len:200 (-) Transcript_39328:185-784(-)
MNKNLFHDNNLFLCSPPLKFCPSVNIQNIIYNRYTGESLGCMHAHSTTTTDRLLSRAAKLLLLQDLLISSYEEEEANLRDALLRLGGIRNNSSPCPFACSKIAVEVVFARMVLCVVDPEEDAEEERDVIPVVVAAAAAVPKVHSECNISFCNVICRSRSKVSLAANISASVFVPPRSLSLWPPPPTLPSVYTPLPVSGS